MTYQTAITKLIEDAGGMLFRSLHPMPEEKLTWKPAETSRHALALTEECIAMISFTTTLLKNRAVPADMNMEWGKDGWKSVDEYEAQFKKDFAELAEAIKAFPDADLETMIELPWATQSYVDVIAYAYWNTIHHNGQIAYIQTLYGDTNFY